MSIDKKEDMRDRSPESIDSTPEPEAGPAHPEHTEQPKRKGGRKPIYATSEERKQRNRQAQAAFRERRTEYIKQLEETIRVHETNLHSLQTAHRSAADECLMLRYKNSLLERILLEKGIDVQAELRAKESPSLGPSHMPQVMAQPPTVQRAIMNRHNQARRSNSNIAPKLEPGPPGHHSLVNPSPQTRPTPSSHHSSPSSASPAFSQPGVMTPPGSEIQHQAQLHQRGQHQMKPQMAAGLPRPGSNGSIMKAPGNNGTGVIGAPTGAYYPSPFQNHIEQLEQEYDAPTDMADDQDTPESAGPGPYPASFANQQLPPLTNAQHRPVHATTNGEHVPGYPSMTQQLLDPYDPMLDMDPFGLSASMHFPTQFTFDTSSMR